MVNAKLTAALAKAQQIIFPPVAMTHLPAADLQRWTALYQAVQAVGPAKSAADIAARVAAAQAVAFPPGVMQHLDPADLQRWTDAYNAVLALAAAATT